MPFLGMCVALVDRMKASTALCPIENAATTARHRRLLEAVAEAEAEVPSSLLSPSVSLLDALVFKHAATHRHHIFFQHCRSVLRRARRLLSVEETFSKTTARVRQRLACGTYPLTSATLSYLGAQLLAQLIALDRLFEAAVTATHHTLLQLRTGHWAKLCLAIVGIASDVVAVSKQLLRSRVEAYSAWTQQLREIEPRFPDKKEAEEALEQWITPSQAIPSDVSGTVQEILNEADNLAKIGEEKEEAEKKTESGNVDFGVAVSREELDAFLGVSYELKEKSDTIDLLKGKKRRAEVVQTMEEPHEKNVLGMKKKKKKKKKKQRIEEKAAASSTVDVDGAVAVKKKRKIIDDGNKLKKRKKLKLAAEGEKTVKKKKKRVVLEKALRKKKVKKLKRKGAD